MLKPIGTDIWHLEAAPLRMPGGMRMPIASTVIRLPDRTLLIYSPVPIDDATAAALAAEGEVAHVIAPNLLHHLYVTPTAERYPRATVYAAPGLRAKRADLRVDRELGREHGSAAPAEWGGAVDVVHIGGAPKIDEHVLFHRPSGTLVCADFVFNITRPANFMTKLALAMTGTGGRKLAQSRVWKLSVRDRAAARASIDEVLRWPIRQVAPVHGEVATIDAAALAPRLERAYGGRPMAMLAGAASASPLG